MQSVLLKSTLITGADGMVGSYTNFGVKFGREELDVTDLGAAMSVCKKYQPKIILHLAALVDLAACEKTPSSAYLANSVGAYNMALAARAVGAKLVHVSTSGVFDGEKSEPYVETDIPNPVNVYGHSKYLGELAIMGVLENFLIVRTSWIFGGGKNKDKKFVGKVMAQLGVAEIKAVEDRRGSPTYAKDLVKTLSTLVQHDARGIVHAGGGDATRFDVAKEVVSIVGSGTRVVPARSSDFTSAYQSGKNESIASSVFVRPWQKALKEYIESEWSFERGR